MAKTKISEFDSNPANNTDIDGINLAEGMAPGLVNNAIRELMAQLKNFQTGSDGDNVSVGGNLAVTGTTALTGAATLAGRAIDAFPSGTKMLFNQTAAPVGWTKDTTHDNKALRVVSGTAGTGGSINFTTAFGSQNVGDTTLTESQIPGHTHSFTGSGSTDSAGDHSHSGTTASAGNHNHNAASSGAAGGGADPSQGRLVDWPNARNHPTSSAGAHVHTFSTNTAGAHVHTVTVSGTVGSTGGGGSHNHSLNLAVQYVDAIICTKT